MPKVDCRLYMPGLKATRTPHSNPLIYNVKITKKPQCIHCHSKELKLKDTFIRRIQHESVGVRRCLLYITVPKYQCKQCLKYFRQPIPGVLPHQRVTEPFKKQIFQQHSDGICKAALAKHTATSSSSIERYFQHCYQLENHKQLNRHWPKVLGIDEHTFKKGVFATTFCDLSNHRVFEVAQGRSSKELIPQLTDIPGREQVERVCIDLSPAYRSFVQAFFPNAKIVADRFHVCRVIDHHFMKTFKLLMPSIKYTRSILNALRTNVVNLKPQQILVINEAFKNCPALKVLYDKKQEVRNLVKQKHLTEQQCYDVVETFLKLITELKESPLEPLNQLARTLKQWRDEIGRAWRFTKNNGTTEGFHRKMKLIQRLAYGFHSFENYRLRVIVLCG